MRYIGLLLSILWCLSACDEAEVGEVHSNAGKLTAAFAEQEVNCFENDSEGEVKVVLSQPATKEVKIRLEVLAERNIREGEDYFLQGREAIVAAGKQEAILKFTLVDDNQANDDRFFTLAMREVVGGSVDTAHSRVKVNVLDDESDMAVGFEGTLGECPEKQEGHKYYLLQVPLKVYGKFSKPVQVEIGVCPLEGENLAVEGKHFRLPEKWVEIRNGNEQPVVAVEIIDDEVVNLNRVFMLEVKSVTGGVPYTPAKRCLMTIMNEDVGIYFNELKKTVVTPTSEIVNIPVSLLAEVDHEITFSVECGGDAVEGVDFILENTTFTIPASTKEVSIPVNILQRPGINPDCNLSLTLISEDNSIQVMENQGICQVTIWDTDIPVQVSSNDVWLEENTYNLRLFMPQAADHDVRLKLSAVQFIGISDSDVKLSASEVVIPAGETEKTVVVTMVTPRQKFKAAFGVELSECLGATLAETPVIINRYFSFTEEKQSPWRVIDKSSVDEHEQRWATYIIDNNNSTFWQSAWQGGGDPLPHYVVLDMLNSMSLKEIEVWRRDHGNRDTRHMKIYLSETISFTEDNLVGELDWGPKSNTKSDQLLVLDEVRSGRYIKFLITESNHGNVATIAEVNIKGFVNN